MPESSQLGRWIMLAGIALVMVGGLVWGLSKLGLSLGRLPGDFRFERGNFSCFFPLASSIFLSVVLTVLLNLLLRWVNR
jgi:hypothetical protein